MTEENQEKTNHDETEQENKQEDVIAEVIDADDQDGTDQSDSNNTDEDSREAELNQLKQEKDDMHQRLLRVQAEFDNFKKRSQKEKEAERKYKAEEVVKELLPAIDNFERALQVEVTDETKSFVDGVTMVYNQITDALKSQGVEEIESVGQPFDPNIHHAVMQVEDEEAESETVTEELQKGYYLKDRVIRPAMVKVNK
ncbi:nucleotide exchange factor GrpE [Lentibacillus sp. CBA3610]|uniref:nucleotide exchange factor GrpE n=1 Tax=Lentibacillus sp. CBA3610 TaxID=2518176 RepID=UPI00159549F7|nr:nucleotide exchange factor GrpE [Lentibacillus sp. CBA3610]QKY69504.1 nucleotide exchange factor GrpE [Lentibacillus sp. CBA3610]